MLIDEELIKKQEERSKKMDNFLDIMLELLPQSDRSELLKSQHSFQKKDKEIINKLSNKELSQEQIKELTSLYNQMKNVLEDILNKN